MEKYHITQLHLDLVLVYFISRLVLPSHLLLTPAALHGTIKLEFLRTDGSSGGDVD